MAAPFPENQAMDTKAATYAPAATRRAPIPEDMLRKYARDKQQRLRFDGAWRLQQGGGSTLAEKVQAVLPGASPRAPARSRASPPLPAARPARSGPA